MALISAPIIKIYPVIYSQIINAINAPIIIGEFGTKASEYDDDFRVNHAGGYVAIAAKYGIKTIWWDNGYLNDYGIIDRNNFSNSKINIIKSLTR